MRISRLSIKNFRGIKDATIHLPKHGVLIGDNNTGKTTVLEAIDLALGPDRLNHKPPINEHDFFRGEYIEKISEIPTEPTNAEITRDESTSQSPRIEIEVTVIELSEEQKARFGDNIEFWDSNTDTFYENSDPTGVDQLNIIEALRITFHGWYNTEEDDFEGSTYFTRTISERDSPISFSKLNKQSCGFLYLRSIRTGTRALSMERGSLLDIILRIKEVRPQMWEKTIQNLFSISIASDPAHGISPILEKLDSKLSKFVPKEWGAKPHLKISDLTREHLRKVITAFVSTGDGDHSAPFFKQGNGTVNMLLLAMLSLIAEEKQNVIFAMEEPETAIAPYAQKSLVNEIHQLASQTLLTSHSPYVLEEFPLEDTVALTRDKNGVLSRKPLKLPSSIKTKTYRQEFRTRFCEGLLSRRILVTEGRSDASAIPVASRRLAELNPKTYRTLESLGICTIDAGSETKIPDIANFFRELGKQVFGLCDLQDESNKTRIQQSVERLFMHNEKGIENLIIKGTTKEALERFSNVLDWPDHLIRKFPNLGDTLEEAMDEYFKSTKGNEGIADFLAQCTEIEIPLWIRDTCRTLKETCAPATDSSKNVHSAKDPH